jgi:hypothetical protein
MKLPNGFLSFQVHPEADGDVDNGKLPCYSCEKTREFIFPATICFLYNSLCLCRSVFCILWFQINSTKFVILFL